MRKNIAKVIAAFQAHKSAQGDSKRSCWTTGEEIYSYSTLIARRLDSGLIWVHERNSTRTTNSQIDAITREFRGMLSCGHEDCSNLPEMARMCAKENA